MVFYPIRIRLCPNLFMVRPSQGHVLLIRLSYLMIRTCIGKQMDTRVRDIYLILLLLYLLYVEGLSGPYSPKGTKC